MMRKKRRNRRDLHRFRLNGWKATLTTQQYRLANFTISPMTLTEVGFDAKGLSTFRVWRISSIHSLTNSI